MNKLQNHTAVYQFYKILQNASKDEMPKVVTGFGFHLIHIQKASSLLRKDRPDIRVIVLCKAKQVILCLKNN